MTRPNINYLQIAAKYFKRAADLGHVDAMKRYAFMLIKGEGIEQNNELGTRYAYLCAQSQCHDNDFIDELKKVFEYIHNGQKEKKLKFPNVLNFFKDCKRSKLLQKKSIL